MALQLNILQPSGTTSTFHVITSIDIRPPEGVIDVIVNGYLSQAAFQSGNTAINTYTQRLPSSVLSSAAVTNAMAALYNYLTNQPMYTGATVVAGS